MFIAQTIEIPVQLALYGVAAVAIFIVGLVVARFMFTPVLYPQHLSGGYSAPPSGCGFILFLALIVATIVAILIAFPGIFEYFPTIEKAGDLSIVEASVPGSSDLEESISIPREDTLVDIFGPVDEGSEFTNVEEPSHVVEEAIAQITFQHAASSREDWAESRARKLRKQGYENVAVIYDPKGGSHPWKIVSLE